MNEEVRIEPAGTLPFVERISKFEIGCVRPDHCELALQLGVFFDGTNNNLERDKETLSDSNIARLFRCYPIDHRQGFSSLYVPGVGTDFSGIGSKAEGWRGTAFAVGCEARVLYALLKTLEFVQLSTGARRKPFTKEQLNVLCQGSKVRTRWSGEAQLATGIGLAGGLQEDGDDSGQKRKQFFQNASMQLQEFLSKSPVRVTEIVIDIFGFSRGAAEARAYAVWLDEVLTAGKLGGIPLTIRFMGLFDTVASAGVIEMLASGANNSTGGHSGWARPKSLRIPARTLTCVHFVAMHEVRKNFPVDSILASGEKPLNLLELAYPGSHSDVGGGYSPGELGIAAGVPTPYGDSLKLSQVPLNDMLDYAVAAGVPMSRRMAMRETSNYDPFSVSEQLRTDFNAFVSWQGGKWLTIAEWTRVYLAWRWQIRNRYREIGHVKMAKQDQHLLMDANRKLILDAEHLLRPSPKPEALRAVKDLIFRPRQGKLEFPATAFSGTKLDIEAGEVLRQAIKYGMPDPAVAAFFDKYVHDSYAGFCADFMEPTGYWRYRKGFQGSEKPMNASANEAPPDIANLA